MLNSKTQQLQRKQERGNILWAMAQEKAQVEMVHMEILKSNILIHLRMNMM